MLVGKGNAIINTVLTRYLNISTKTGTLAHSVCYLSTLEDFRAQYDEA